MIVPNILHIIQNWKSSQHPINLKLSPNAIKLKTLHPWNSNSEPINNELMCFPPPASSQWLPVFIPPEEKKPQNSDAIVQATFFSLSSFPLFRKSLFQLQSLFSCHNSREKMWKFFFAGKRKLLHAGSSFLPLLVLQLLCFFFPVSAARKCTVAYVWEERKKNRGKRLHGGSLNAPLAS